MNEKNLAETHPKIAAEWHPTKNGKLTPYDVTAGKGLKVWWKCKNGHEWEAKICNRTRRDRSHTCGCPYCTNHKLCLDNCLAILSSEIAAEWHPTKNGNLTPYDVMVREKIKVWWKCKNGHEWETTVYNRTRKGSIGSCPYCSNRKVSMDNCLATLYPEIAAQWHPSKNGKLTPHDVSAHSNKDAWWQGKCGHEWPAVINSRPNSGCPCCSGHRVCLDNCLATLYPEIAAQWHPTKNGKLTPHDVIAGSSRKICWMCQDGHEWDTTIYKRVNGSGCPYCNSYILFNGESYASLIECHYALKFHKEGIKFVHNVMYPDLGKRRFDFHLLENNEYIEVTSFNSKYERLKEYMKNIEIKRRC